MFETKCFFFLFADITEYEGINFRHELGKIRGGGLLWEMIKHNDLKVSICCTDTT